MRIAIISVFAVALSSFAAVNDEEIHDWWLYANPSLGVRFVYPEEWALVERKSGDVTRISIGPQHESVITLTIGPAKRDKQLEAWDRSILAEPTTKVTTVTVAGQRVRQVSYLVYKYGYHTLVGPVVHEATTVSFVLDDMAASQGEQAFDKLLKSFRFTRQRRLERVPANSQ